MREGALVIRKVEDFPLCVGSLEKRRRTHGRDIRHHGHDRATRLSSSQKRRLFQERNFYMVNSNDYEEQKQLKKFANTQGFTIYDHLYIFRQAVSDLTTRPLPFVKLQAVSKELSDAVGDFFKIQNYE